MNLQFLVLSVLPSQTKVTPALLTPNSHCRVAITHHAALETKEEGIALLTYTAGGTDRQEKLFPGILQCGLQGGFILKGTFLLQTIYLNKQD